MEDEVEISGLPTLNPRVALPDEAHLHPVLYACRNLDFDAAFFALPPRSPARMTRRRNVNPCSAASRTWSKRGKRAEEGGLCLPNLARAFALRARFGLSAGFRAGAVAGVARRFPHDLNRLFEACRHFFECHLNVGAKILSVHAGPPATGWVAAPRRLEEHVEDRAERILHPAEARAAASPVVVHAVMPVGIVAATFLRVTENGIGFVDGFETGFGLGIVRVHIGMAFPRQLAKRGFDVVG